MSFTGYIAGKTPEQYARQAKENDEEKAKMRITTTYFPWSSGTGKRHNFAIEYGNEAKQWPDRYAQRRGPPPCSGVPLEWSEVFRKAERAAETLEESGLEVTIANETDLTLGHHVIERWLEDDTRRGET